ncbi:SGNH/GDSL hydrolase family protein [Ketobacter alkanivorans]|uniref:SGNH hydrolase-type esterase domain-containing protein n=1 Tax=Ketobacter alkanivorans TaxID=1917421 RepID=A0A2K9LNG9_9GAMM|nr:hypothetical protein [Ketobacter alkanivorans]AUM13025.1 hypothetical protein Kalk_11585 [Ketobacter alkanivorans]
MIKLGTNDFQSTHTNEAWMSAQGVAKLISVTRNSPIEPGMPIPEILVVAPPWITNPMGSIASKFKGAESRYVGLPEELEKVTSELGMLFYDSNKSVCASAVDGIHLDQIQHRVLGMAIAAEVVSWDVLM